MVLDRDEPEAVPDYTSQSLRHCRGDCVAYDDDVFSGRVTAVAYDDDMFSAGYRPHRQTRRRIDARVQGPRLPRTLRARRQETGTSMTSVLYTHGYFVMAALRRTFDVHHGASVRLQEFLNYLMLRSRLYACGCHVTVCV